MPPPHRKKQGWSSRYLSRTQSLRKLQLSLKSFRQLCIYKGIHPRVPKRVGGDARVFYHNKDIKFLAHEPSIATLRLQRKFNKKIRAAKHRKDAKEVLRLQKKFPRLSLAHVLKERYPTFNHALRDLDDPLTMAHLFANLDQQGNYRDGSELYASASRLCTEFQAYVVKTQSLRKVFVSVKGYYYQADIMGTLVTWCVPHKFVQHFNHQQIDPFILTCYMEFYKTMLTFVHYKLYHSVGMKYPPHLNSKAKQSAFPLEALIQEFAKKKEKSKITLMEQDSKDEEEEELVEILDEDEEIGEKAAGKTKHVSVGDDASLCAKLFSGFVFLLGRETPLDQLIFVIRSFGGSIVLEDDLLAKDFQDHITHCICDRPQLKENKKVTGREYVQPQWVFDSCNARVLLPTDPYSIGKKAPPHLSPFVAHEDEGYVPDYAKEIRKIQEAANLVREANDTSAQKKAIEDILEHDVEFQEQEKHLKAEQEEQEYLQELELELETEFPGISVASEKTAAEERKKRRMEETLQDTQKMEEIMVKKKFHYKKLKHKEKSKQAKVQKLQQKKKLLNSKSS